MERAACDADAMSVAYLDEVPKGPAVDENFVVLSRTEHDEAEAYRAAHPERIAAAKKKHQLF